MSTNFVFMSFYAGDGQGESCQLPVNRADYIFVDVFGFGTKFDPAGATVYSNIQMQRAVRDAQHAVTGVAEIDEALSAVRRIVNAATGRGCTDGFKLTI